MIKVYGMKACPYCEYVKPQLDERFRYLDIGESVVYLKQFVDLRENNKAFDEAKNEDDLGIPCFVLEDGTITLNPHDVGLKSLSDTLKNNACSVNGHC